LTVLGKIVGGGLPVGAYGGRAEIMRNVMPAGPIFQAGTLSGNPLAMAAGIATLEELRDHPPYAHLEQMGKMLAEGLMHVLADSDLPHQVAHVGSMWTLFFNPHPVRDYDFARLSDTSRFAKFFWGMMDRGIYLPCSQFEAAFISAVHTEQHISRTIAAAREVLAKME
jgi:glutamate-1-semialdehyde 2,1-aminomutase